MGCHRFLLIWAGPLSSKPSSELPPPPPRPASAPPPPPASTTSAGAASTAASASTTSAGGVSSLLQVTDLRNSPGPAKKDFRVAVKQVLDLFQDNYPELVARNIQINVQFWYYAFSTLFYPFMTQRTKSKFVIARPSKVTETTLLKWSKL